MQTPRFYKIAGILFSFAGILLVAGIWAGADEVDTTKVNEAYLVKGELVTLKADGVTRLSVTNPEVADIVKAGENEILMVGQSVGQTALFIWDKQGKRAVTVYVFNQNLELVKERIEKLFKAADISEIKLEIDGQESKVVASGYIPKYKKERFDEVIEKFGQDVMNLVKEEEVEDLIQVDVQIAEVSASLLRGLGIQWSTGTQTTSSSGITTTSSGSLAPVYGEIMPSLDGSVGDFFKIGQFQRATNSALIAQIDALITSGKARILSQPKLVVKSGEEASFLVGGEIPIRTTTATTSGGTQENVSFKKYGINMTITPEIKKEKIDITLNVEISDVDSANASGNTVAFTTRSAQTKLYLDNGQSIVLAGLIKHNRSETLKKVPFLGDIPVVGLLFRHRSTPTADQDQEVVISLTPTVLERNRSGTPVSTPASAKIEAESFSVTSAAKDVTEAAVPPEAQALQKPFGGTEEIVSTPESQASPIQELVPAAVTPSTTVNAGSESTVVISAASDVADAAVVPGTQSPSFPESNSLSADASSVSLPKDMDEYVRAVQQKIAEAVIYPQEAEQSGWEGTVKLGLLILSDGTLATAMVRESSGYEVFDDYTLSVAKKSAPYSSFPSGAQLRELNVTIPVVYSLKKN